MSKKRIDLDEFIKNIPKHVKKRKPSTESLVAKFESGIKAKKEKSETSGHKSATDRSARKKDSLGFQIQNPTKYIPKTQYSKFRCRQLFIFNFYLVYSYYFILSPDRKII